MSWLVEVTDSWRARPVETFRRPMLSLGVRHGPTFTRNALRLSSFYLNKGSIDIHMVSMARLTGAMASASMITGMPGTHLVMFTVTAVAVV